MATASSVVDKGRRSSAAACLDQEAEDVSSSGYALTDRFASGCWIEQHGHCAAAWSEGTDRRKVAAALSGHGLDGLLDEPRPGTLHKLSLSVLFDRVASPLLSNIRLHEFDEWMVEENYLSKKVRKDRWPWNFSILKQRPITVRAHRQWKPAVSYCRYADDFVIVVKGTPKHAEAVREACREFLEGELKLTLNMEKTHISHVNDGFVFLGHLIIRDADHAAACVL